MTTNDATQKLSKRIAEHGELLRRQAIRDTDWSETAVLRIIEHYPEMQPLDWESGSGKFTLELPEYEVERYQEQAPPAAEHADGKRRCSVQTITKPLLDKVGEEYPELFDAHGTI